MGPEEELFGAWPIEAGVGEGEGVAAMEVALEHHTHNEMITLLDLFKGGEEDLLLLVGIFLGVAMGAIDQEARVEPIETLFLDRFGEGEVVVVGVLCSTP